MKRYVFSLLLAAATVPAFAGGCRSFGQCRAARLLRSHRYRQCATAGTDLPAAGHHSEGLRSSAAAPALLACAPRPREEMEQALPEVRRLQPAGVLCEGRLVHQRLCAPLPASARLIQRQGPRKG